MARTAKFRSFKYGPHRLGPSCAALLAAALALPAAAAQLDIPGPAGSVAFGAAVATLPNGNIVVTDPSGGPLPNAGAVHLYGPDGTLISSLTGARADDAVGNGGIVVLSNGNYVVISPMWDSASATNAGAVTWVNGSTGIAGVVSANNSLVGSSNDDYVGYVITLSNGNYVVASSQWDHGALPNVGAVTWVNGATGLVGPVADSNSLIGTSGGDSVGNVYALSNGNYVVRSQGWDNGNSANVGAVTWANGTSGLIGVVSPSNSLIGSNPPLSMFGNLDVFVLSNGNYVVRSNTWSNGATANVGAVTWADGSTGLVGTVSASNSLVGTTVHDAIGSGGIVDLKNGNFLVVSSAWDKVGAANAGAVTWVDGDSGLVGTVSAQNSLTGTATDDFVGGSGVTVLSNGNYVVRSGYWDDVGNPNVGALTWADGSMARVGLVTAANSLIGKTNSESVSGSSVIALSNGNYVVSSRNWDNGALRDVGAVTWASGNGGLSGTITTGNSLIGASEFDHVGDVTALSNGHYVVTSSAWDSSAYPDVGAVTWADGSQGRVGVVAEGNSLIGTRAGDALGYYGAVAMSDGNYTIASPYWDNGGSVDVGAITWARGNGAITGTVTPFNSLVGTTPDDRIGTAIDCSFTCPPMPPVIIALAGGAYVAQSFYWDAGSIENAGALTFGRGNVGASGHIVPANSVLGSQSDESVGMSHAYDAARERLVVGRSTINRVSVLTLSPESIFSNGFEECCEKPAVDGDGNPPAQ